MLEPVGAVVRERRVGGRPSDTCSTGLNPEYAKLQLPVRGSERITRTDTIRREPALSGERRNQRNGRAPGS